MTSDSAETSLAFIRRGRGGTTDWWHGCCAIYVAIPFHYGGYGAIRYAILRDQNNSGQEMSKIVIDN